MRVLVTIQHFHPMVPLAKALEAAGHEVAFVASEDNRPAMKAVGFTFFPAGTSMGELMPMLMPKIQQLSGEALVAFILGEVWGRMLPERFMQDAPAIAEQWQPDLIVRDMTETGGLILAEHLGVPHASVEIGAYDPVGLGLLEPPLNDLRAKYDLPPSSLMESFFRYLHLAFVPPGYQDPAADYPATGHAFRHVYFDQSGDETLPIWLAALPDQPTIYTTLGTSFGRMTHVFEQIIQGLRDEAVNLIITTGRGIDPAQFGPQPDTVRIERYIPQSLLFPQVDAVIAHGGWNTILAALTHELPLLNIPLGADQPINAARCERLGVGRTLQPDALTPAAVREAALDVLNTPSYRTAAARFNAQNNALPGIDRAVGLLEQLQRERQPILAS